MKDGHNIMDDMLDDKFFLVDTNTLSEQLRSKPNEKVLAKIKLHHYEIATAAQVLFEITAGCYKLPDSKKRRAIKRYIDEFILPHFPILPYDEKAAAWHGEEQARLVKKTWFCDYFSPQYK
jgi:tRNA(fMet)-specific endonuclease VapC